MNFGAVNSTKKAKMNMSKKHFVAAAKDVAEIKGAKSRRAAAEILAKQFAAENPRFDRARFMAACGVK